MKCQMESSPRACQCLISRFFFVLSLLWIFIMLDGVISCPDGCACIQNDHVICNLGGLTKIPFNIPFETNYISLNDNRISQLKTDSFKKLTQLKFVYLEKNNITEIFPYAFRGLANMEEITIEKNPLDHLGSYSFASLKNIRRIYLGNNKINTIRANAFFDSDNIREISLIGNPLTVLQSNAFSGFTNVHFFYFPKGISVIEKDAFNTLKHVQMLRLDNMTINQLEPHTFRGLSNVAGLELRGSHIGIIRKGTFEGLTNVDYLGIDHCTLEKIQKDAFKGLANISSFVLNFNTIESIEAHSFWGLELPTQVKHFNFSDNRIPCNCQLHYLIDNLEKSTPDFIDHNYCHIPKEYGGLPVSEVQIDTLDQCPPEPTLIQPAIHHHHMEPEPEDDSSKSESNNVVDFLSGNGAVRILNTLPILTNFILILVLYIFK